MPNKFRIESGVNPEQSRIRYLEELTSRGLFHKEIGGYLGASFEALQLCIRTGKFYGRPVDSQEGDFFQSKGDLYFYPGGRIKNKVGINYSELDDFWLIEQARGYAKDSTENAVLAKLADLDLDSPEQDGLVRELSCSSGEELRRKLNFPFFNSAKMLEILRRAGLNKEKLLQVSFEFDKKMSGREGIIVGLSRRIYKDYEVKQGDEGPDLYISVPGGLDIKYLRGLEVEGDYEKRAFEQLTKG